MNRETIEKAAKEYAEENAWYPGDTSYESDIREMEGAFADAYKAGAQWRINSVWHDVDEKPKFKGKVEVSSFLVLRKSGQIGLIQVSKDDWEDVLELTKFVKWADVDDLIPDGKEAELLKGGNDGQTAE